MKKLLFFAFIVLTAASLWAQEGKYGDEQGKRPVKLSPPDALEYKLREMDKLYLSKLRRGDYQKAEILLEEMYYILDLIRGKLDPPVYMPIIMQDRDFNDLLTTLKNEAFESNQLKVLEIAARYGFFSVDQLVEIVGIFTFSSGKLTAVKIVFPQVADKFNSYRLVKAFTFMKDKEDVEKIINGRE